MSKAVIVHQLSKDFVLNNTSRAMKNLFVEIFKKSEPKNRQLVLDKLDLEIKHGQFFGIAGRNGSGKSTLLKVIAGIYPPASGSVKVNGSLVPFIELGVGFNGGVDRPGEYLSWWCPAWVYYRTSRWHVPRYRRLC